MNSNNYFAYSPTRILYDKVKLTNGHACLGDKRSLDPAKISFSKQLLLLHMNASHLYSVSISVESSVVSVSKTSRNITILTLPSW